MKHRKLLNPEFIPYMNLTIIVEGGKERLYSLRSIIEQRCPSLLLAVKYIKKKKEKKGITGPVGNKTTTTNKKGETGGKCKDIINPLHFFIFCLKNLLLLNHVC